MHRDFARNPTTVLHDDRDLLWFTTPGSNAWLNGASWCDLGDDVDARIAAVGNAAHAVGARAQWITSPSCRPSDLGARLQAQGWEPEVELEEGLARTILLKTGPPRPDLGGVGL